LTVTRHGQSFFEYRFKEPVPLADDVSLVIQYQTETALGIELLVNGVERWEAKPTGATQVQYAVPVGDIRVLMSVSAKPAQTGSITVQSLSLVPRWYGFERNGSALSITAFVEQEGQGRYRINPPLPDRGALALNAASGADRIVVEAGGTRFEAAATVHIPAGMLPAQAFPIVIAGAASARLAVQRLSTLEPVRADPQIVLDYPQSKWRTSQYEVFAWEQFPSILIFDTASYAVQDDLLKRLAFFVEKAGFRGRLASDREIANLHGWNAHDYRAADLARFFDQALRTNFPLNEREFELQALLLHNGIIRRSASGFEAGQGALISISRQSSALLRARFMAHEGFHGIFFIDEGFRALSRERFETLSPVAKRFILSFFEYQQYDITDDYLVVNEFMAYILQQPTSQAGAYFGTNLAGQIAAHPWRYTVLPRRDSSGSYPELAVLFQTEAEVFSAYVQEHFGLSAGTVSRLHITKS
jgi:hypothetical protein